MHSHQFPLAVVIPTYNRVDVLMQCLTHLEHQTQKDFEVVIVDDGSTDSTQDELRSYALRTPLALRYVRQENSGPARARNHAISLVRAPICLMIGDDIFVSPNFVERHIQLHLQQPDPVVVGLGLTRWSETGQTVSPFMRWMDEGLQFDYGRLLRGKQPDWRDFYTSNLSAKTEILKRFPFDESFPYAAMEDMELAYRIEAQCGLKLIFLPEALAYHLHPTTFVQACNRMVRIGESSAHFDQIWPSAIRRNRNPIKKALRSSVRLLPMALSLCTKLANWSLKLACPNLLMSFVLGCYFEMGYDGYLRRAKRWPRTSMERPALPETRPESIQNIGVIAALEKQAKRPFQ